MRATYLGLSVLIVFFHLLPLQTTPGGWAPPDMLVALSFAWAIRRPDYVPALAIAGVMLLADLLFHRPPGLWAALVLVAAEWLKRQARGMRETGFALEWLTVALALTVISLAYRLVLGVLFTPQAPLALTIIQLVMTLVAYPVVVLVSQVILGVRKSAPGEVDNLGHRL